MDINDNVLVIGNSKGYLTAYEQTWENVRENLPVPDSGTKNVLNRIGD